MDRVVLIVGAVTIAIVVAQLIGRRRPAPPTNPSAHVPAQVDRNDFARPDVPWLVAVFTADTCTTCAGVWERAQHLTSSEVSTQELEVGRDAAVHERYGIDAVPTTLIADREGVVRRWFLGPVNSTDLWAAVAELRQPGSVPPWGSAGGTG